MAAEFSISSVTERDVDLLLLEEFVASPIFAKWFVQQIADLDLPAEPVLSAHRSVTTSSGESDLEIAIVSSDERVHYLLIENKISAGFQPRQADRYRQRGDAYVRQGDCDGYLTVLVAPAKYIGGDGASMGFDKSLSYEAIRDWFESAARPADRYAVKQKLLSAAIDKSSLGYQRVEDLPVSTFWHSYWRVATEVCPELEMDEPVSKPAGAGFVWFRPAILPKQVTLVHKLPRGYVDLQFAGMGPKLSELRSRFEANLAPDMIVVRANLSGAVRLKVPVLDTTFPFEEQEAKVRQGIACAKRLLQWYGDKAALR